LNDRNQSTVGIGGARSPVGRHLVRLLQAAHWRVEVFSRNDFAAHRGPSPAAPIANWVFASPIWAVAEHLAFLGASGARRVVAISSTSRFTKSASADRIERDLAQLIEASEERLGAWAAANGVDCTILRPTLIYGGGDDRNISEVAAFIRRFGVFPLLGPASGLRQPIHVEDVAAACVAALPCRGLKPAYDISGGEVLPYREMVCRVFRAMGRSPRFITVPRPAVRAGIGLVRLVPRFRSASPGMAERMMSDMVFDHSEAGRDFGFRPRPFVLGPQDVRAAGPEADRSAAQIVI
jgi:nucleoside-diphosphate-sugar epimerase